MCGSEKTLAKKLDTRAFASPEGLRPRRRVKPTCHETENNLKLTK
jgi:hypothetical protein